MEAQQVVFFSRIHKVNLKITKVFIVVVGDSKAQKHSFIEINQRNI